MPVPLIVREGVDCQEKDHLSYLFLSVRFAEVKYAIVSTGDIAAPILVIID